MRTLPTGDLASTLHKEIYTLTCEEHTSFM
jgi:hypothetical protein